VIASTVSLRTSVACIYNMTSPDPNAKSSAPPTSTTSTTGATLAPPAQPSRPSSANSNSSRRSRGQGSNKSGNTTRSNSHSSRGDGSRGNGNSTTIGGGVKLTATAGKGKQNSSASGANDGDRRDANGQGKGKGKKGNGASGAAGESGNQPKAQGKRPQPIDTGAPPRSVSADSDKPDNEPRSLHAHVSPPRTALDAAFEAAHKKHSDIGSGDALTSLQKMISDLKAISPVSGTAPSLPSGSTSGRSMSMSQGDRSRLQPPVAIPSAGATGKLKADAPSFTPSLSPGVSHMALSPSNALPSAAVPPRAASFAAGSGQRRTSSASVHGMPAPMANYPLPPPSGSFSAGSNFQNPLSGLPELDDNESMNQYGIDFAYQQQILAAQYQQIQLLQAQIQANQLAQQQAQQQNQQNQSTSFIAPRFQALAAQRIQQQQEQQIRLHQAHEQAQQLYQNQALQIAQHNQAQKQHQRSDSQAVAEQTPVFEEDSPERKPVALGTSGRPQLNPNFTFGAKRQETQPQQESMSPPAQPPVINRSEGIGGAAAAGLAGLAARAHKRTGSEVTPAMQEQVS
jgi:protein SSD1